jgi:secreted Zn-dependent insulinase-like peptidase
MTRPTPAAHPSGLVAALLVVLCLLAVTASAATQVVKSDSDPRSYRALVLDNALKVILVSDPATDMAAASLSVNVGSGADPADRAGLAHFLEHMLFLGTAKYPQPGEYKDFISRHGGGENAYTAADETNYFFEIGAGQLEPALDRFAQFFIAPLFNQEYVQREREVVHSEYLGRRTDDARRIQAAVQQVMNPAHPYASFAVGNLETLADRPGSDVRAELLAFYDRHYSANLMALTVVGKEPLDELERWVRARFSLVPNRDAAPFRIQEPLFADGTLPARLDVLPERESYSISYRFPIPPVRDHWRAKPDVHVAHLLGHEGESSLLAELKRRGWAQALSAGTGFDTHSGATLDVSISLTPAGSTHADEITALLFRYVQVIRDGGVERWLFDENARLAAIEFRFSEKPSPTALARRLARMQHLVPQAQVLRASYAFDDWRPELVRELLDALRPGNVLITRVAPGLDTDRTAPWYDTPYRLTRLDDGDIPAWRDTPQVAALAVPEPNPFIPQQLEMLPPAQREIPMSAMQRPGFRLWHLQDGSFALPKADFFFSLRSPHANDSPRRSVLTRLYVDAINDQLDAFAYAADLAGLSFSLYVHSRGLSVRISGYHDRQSVLLERILAALSDPELDPQRIEMLKEAMKRSLENSRRDQPYNRAMSRLRDMLIQPNWTVEEQLAVIDGIGVEQLARHAADLLARVEVVALAHGNLDTRGARELGELVHATLVAPAQVVSVPRARVMQLQRADRLAAQVTAEHPESALVLYLQARDTSLVTRARAALLAQLLSAPFFDELRTQKQLGYVVSVNAYPVLDSAGVVFMTQSAVAGAGMLQHEVLAFLERFGARIADLNEADLEQHKRALAARVMEEERQLSERSARWWEEIDRENLRFDTREQVRDAILAIGLTEFREFYSSVLLDAGRRQLAIRVIGQGIPDPAAAALRRSTERVVTPAWVRDHRDPLPG